MVAKETTLSKFIDTVSLSHPLNKQHPAVAVIVAFHHLFLPCFAYCTTWNSNENFLLKGRQEKDARYVYT